MNEACAAIIEISKVVSKEAPKGNIITYKEAEEFFMQFYDDEAIDQLEFFKVIQAWIRKDENK